jgi:hypothetical protein
MGKFKDLTGNVYGRLTVIKLDSRRIKPKSQLPSIYWLCKCICGKEKVIAGSSLKQNLTKSCGCIVKESGLKISGHRSSTRGAFDDLHNVYMRGAKKRNLIFNLTIDEFKNLTSNNCHYCDIPPSQVRKSQSKYNSESKNYTYNGIDRLDSTKGYILGNVVSCCHTCNIMKRDKSYLEFLIRIEKIYEKLIKKKLK